MTNPYKFHRSKFSPEECQRITNHCDKLEPISWNMEEKCNRGTVKLDKMGSMVKDPEICEFVWLRTIPLFKAYPISKVEYPQYGVYEKGSFMDWHLDRGKEDYMKHRLCAAILQLSSPNDYQGGLLEIEIGPEKIDQIPIALGSVIVIDSMMLHRVTEVTKGTRKTLVMWGLE